MRVKNRVDNVKEEKEEKFMAATIPDKVLDLFEKPAFAHLATVMPDGTPQVTPVWVDFDGTYVRVNTAKGRLKERNMQQRSKVGLAMTDPQNAYRWLSIRGRVAEITEEGALAHINKLSKKYTGNDKYQRLQPGEVRVICKILPEHVASA
jgi:PPOX class probable F420-dependent enzyme